MRKWLILFVAICCSASTVCAKPVVDKSDQAKRFLVQKAEMSGYRLVVTRPSEWFINRDSKAGSPYVTSVIQIWNSTRLQRDIQIEAAVFPTQTDALLAAELRVKELRDTRHLEEQALKGGKLPQQAGGDRVWGLWDPPDPGAKPAPRQSVGPISTFAAVVFNKKEVVICATSRSGGMSVDFGELEQLAKKIATNIKPAMEVQLKQANPQK